MAAKEKQAAPATPAPDDDKAKSGFDEIHAALKPIADRSAHYDVRQLATVMLRLVELLGDGKQKTEIPPRHHA